MKHRFGICLLAVVALSNVSIADNWPQWRGPQGNAISVEKGIATSWSPTANIRFRSPLPGQGGATPAVWGDKVFVSSADKDDLVLICIDSKSGKQQWQRKVGSGNQDARAGEGNSASPSVSTDGNHVWVFFSTGVLACFDFEGNEKWKLDVGQRFGKLDIQFGLTSTPLLHGDSLYLQLIHGAMNMKDPSRTGKVIRLDKATGKTTWEVDRNTEAIFECKHSYASPFLYSDGTKEFLVVHGADCTTGHQLSDGKEIWRLGELNGPSKYNAKRNDPTFRFVASPAVTPGYIIIPTAKEGPTVALKVNDSLTGDCSKNAEVVAWSLPQTPDVSIPIIVDRLVYLLHKDGKLQCLELETGKQVYMNRTHTAQHRASPLYVDGHLYLASNDGHCSVIKAGSQFEIVSSNDLKEPITASPIVANGTLYLRTYEALYAVENGVSR